MPEPYKIADLYLQTLSQRIKRRFDKTKRKLTVLGFDELNVLQETDALYKSVEADFKKVIRVLYANRYTEVYRWLKGKEPDEDYVDELIEMYLTGVMNEPNEVTHYEFQTELIRKRDRAKEAILAVPTKTQKQLEMEKAGRYVIQQTGFYVDFASQDAEIQAFKDAGVMKVKRHEMHDSRVCAECREADGKVYEVDKIPPLPHVRCRRWFSKV